MRSRFDQKQPDKDGGFVVMTYDEAKLLMAEKLTVQPCKVISEHSLGPDLLLDAFERKLQRIVEMTGYKGFTAHDMR